MPRDLTKERAAYVCLAVIRVVRPTRGLLQGGAYTRSEATDLKARFERMAAEALDFSGPSLRELKARRK